MKRLKTGKNHHIRVIEMHLPNLKPKRMMEPSNLLKRKESTLWEAHFILLWHPCLLVYIKYLKMGRIERRARCPAPPCSDSLKNTTSG